MRRVLLAWFIIVALVLVGCAAHTNYSLSDDQITKMSDQELYAKHQEIVAEINEHTNALNGINRNMSTTSYSNAPAIGSGFGNVFAGSHHKSAGWEGVRQGKLIEEEMRRRGLKIPDEP
jgi:hypothetical protein